MDTNALMEWGRHLAAAFGLNPPPEAELRGELEKFRHKQYAEYEAGLLTPQELTANFLDTMTMKVTRLCGKTIWGFSHSGLEHEAHRALGFPDKTFVRYHNKKQSIIVLNAGSFDAASTWVSKRLRNIRSVAPPKDQELQEWEGELQGQRIGITAQVVPKGRETTLSVTVSSRDEKPLPWESAVEFGRDVFGETGCEIECQPEDLRAQLDPSNVWVISREGERLHGNVDDN